MAECIIVGNGGSDNIDQLILLDETVDGYKTINNTVKFPFVYFCTYGKSIQNDIPTPDAPIPIDDIGDNGAVTITVDNGNDISLSATITSGLPLCSIGDVRDELVYNADGTGKIIKRIGKHSLLPEINWDWTYNRMGVNYNLPNVLNATAAISNYFHKIIVYTTWIDVYTDDFANDVAGFKDFLTNNDVYILYQLAIPQEIELSADEITALMKLQTFNGVTHIYNDEGAEMRVKIAALTGD